jgi:hypothetical protein
MHDPESGRTQVPIVCSIVLLLVAVFFAYHEHEARVAVEKDLNEILAAASDASSPSRTPKAAAIHYITQARGVYARQRERLEQILEVTGGADETDPELFVDPVRLKTVQTRFLKAIDSGEFTIEFPMEDGTKFVAQYGLTKDLRGSPPNLSNIVEYVVIPAMRRMFSDIKRYRDLCSTALGEKDAAVTAHRSAVKALTAERDDWRRKAEHASAELEALKQR